MEDELMKLCADTKFEVGQTVYRVYETRKNIEQKATCDVCLGTGKITYKGYKCNCPKCNGRGELVTDSKEVTLREIDVPREVTAIRLIANKENSGLLKYVLNVPHGCHSAKKAKNSLFLLSYLMMWSLTSSILRDVDLIILNSKLSNLITSLSLGKL